jgi:hypothetical protein
MSTNHKTRKWARLANRGATYQMPGTTLMLRQAQRGIWHVVDLSIDGPYADKIIARGTTKTEAHENWMEVAR